MSPVPPASPAEGSATEREAILAATLDHVAFDGWTPKALAAAVAELGLPPATGRLAFPGGVAEVIRAWSASLDERMSRTMVASQPGSLSLPERIGEAVMLRLALAAPHKEAARRAISFLALPPNQAVAPRLTYDTVNAIWYAVGDRATSLSFYSKRLTLAAIYASTVLYWLDDSSEDAEATRAFLARRLADLGRVAGLRSRLAAGFSGFARPFDRLRPKRVFRSA